MAEVPDQPQERGAEQGAPAGDGRALGKRLEQVIAGLSDVDRHLRAADSALARVRARQRAAAQH